jgi:hypothetical protein
MEINLIRYYGVDLSGDILIENPWSPVKRLLTKFRQRKYCEILRYKCYFSRERIYIILQWPSLLFLFLTAKQRTNVIKLHRDSSL